MEKKIAIVTGGKLWSEFGTGSLATTSNRLLRDCLLFQERQS